MGLMDRKVNTLFPTGSGLMGLMDTKVNTLSNLIGVNGINGHEGKHSFQLDRG